MPMHRKIECVALVVIVDVINVARVPHALRLHGRVLLTRFKSEASRAR